MSKWQPNIKKKQHKQIRTYKNTSEKNWKCFDYAAACVHIWTTFTVYRVTTCQLIIQQCTWVQSAVDGLVTNTHISVQHCNIPQVVCSCPTHSDLLSCCHSSAKHRDESTLSFCTTITIITSIQHYIPAANLMPSWSRHGCHVVYVSSSLLPIPSSTAANSSEDLTTLVLNTFWCILSQNQHNLWTAFCAENFSSCIFLKEIARMWL